MLKTDSKPNNRPIIGESVKFKSWDVYWKKEKSGKKPNTLREFDKTDSRFAVLKRWSVYDRYGSIIIENATTGDTFTRHVKDVTFYGIWCIISW